MSLYGSELPATVYTPLRSVIASPEKSASDNLVIRVGRQNVDGSWSRTEHVVLTPREASLLLAEIDALGFGPGLVAETGTGDDAA